MANGGIMYLKKGSEVTGWLASLTKKAVNNLPKKKDGTVRMNSKEANRAKAEFNAKKKAEAQEKRKKTLEAKKKEADRKKMLEERADADVAAARGRDRKAYDEERLKKLKEMNELNQPVGPPRPPNGPMPSQGPAIASKVDDANASSGAARKADDAIDDPIQPGGDPNVDTRTLTQKVIPYISPNVFNPATKARGTKTIAGIIAGASLLPEGEDTTVTGSDTGDGDVTITGNDELDQAFNNDTEGNLVDKLPPNDWATIMKTRIVNDRGIPLDDKGNFTEKPKFMDYLKSLPGAYADKVSRDEDFAKKMIAGFLNMMRPVEGFVPVNSAVQFGDAYLAEETRQADMLPADAKMLEYLRNNPGMLDDYMSIEGSRAGVLLNEVNPSYITDHFNNLLDALSRRSGIPIDDIAKGQAEITFNGKPVDETFIYGVIGKGANLLADPRFTMRRKFTTP